MHWTHFEALLTVVGSLAVAVSVVAAGLRWIYQQGVSSQKLVNSIDFNTSATDKLSGAFERFSERTDGTLTDHEHRITRVEDKFADLHDDVRAGRKGTDASAP
jgi:hypothetical protein